MTPTLETVKAEHNRLAEMIASIEAELKKPTFFEHQGRRIPLEHGERYIGTIASADGSRSHHIILLPGEVESKNWKDANDWATSIGGELPDRVEGALLFATAKGEFTENWYWTREQHSAYPACAWYQHFTNGTQSLTRKCDELRFRAVRRLPI